MGIFKTVTEIVLGTKKARFGDGETQLRASIWEVGSPPKRGLGLREWWQNDAGKWCPSKNGISLRPSHLVPMQQLMDLIVKAEEESAPPFEPRDPSGIEWTHISNSKYAGQCCVCGKQYSEGAAVGYDSHGEPGSKGAHWACAAPGDDDDADADETDDPREVF